MVPRIAMRTSEASASIPPLMTAHQPKNAAYTVAQRTREFGLRMALGANGGTVRGMVLRQVGFMTLVGSVIGILAAFGLGRAAQSILFGMEGFDPMVVGLVTLLLAAVSIGAGYLPALRASRVDPMKALRYE